MRIYAASDHHIDFSWIDPHEGIEDCDVLVIAGDVCELRTGLLKKFMSTASKHARHVVYVAGNHEHYGGNIRNSGTVIRNQISGLDNVHFLDNSSVEIDGVTFYGTTLWTDLKKSKESFALSALSDFRTIRDGDDTLSIEGYRKLHEKSSRLLEEFLLENDNQCNVVVTHHCPTYYVIDRIYYGNPLNSCFASNLDRLIPLADLWVCGHTHKQKLVSIGGSLIVCNPRGYNNMVHNENPNFSPALIELNEEKSGWKARIRKHWFIRKINGGSTSLRETPKKVD